MQWFYNLLYSRFRAPWDIGPRQELVECVTSGRPAPGRAIDLGSGTASNCVFLAQHGFDVTGVDYTEAAIVLGRKRAAAAGVSVNFIQDDLTHLRHVTGAFDVLVDYGTLDDLSPPARDRYVHNILPLTRPGSQFLLYGFEWEPRGWERPFFSRMALLPGEVARRFSPYFSIERYAGASGLAGFPRGWAVYMLTRSA